MAQCQLNQLYHDFKSNCTCMLFQSGIEWCQYVWRSAKVGGATLICLLHLQEHHTADTAASGGGKQVKPGTRGLGEIATAEVSPAAPVFQPSVPQTKTVLIFKLNVQLVMQLL